MNFFSENIINRSIFLFLITLSLYFYYVIGGYKETLYNTPFVCKYNIETMHKNIYKYLFEQPIFDNTTFENILIRVFKNTPCIDTITIIGNTPVYINHIYKYINNQIIRTQYNEDNTHINTWEDKYKNIDTELLNDGIYSEWSEPKHLQNNSNNKIILYYSTLSFDTLDEFSITIHTSIIGKMRKDPLIIH